MASDSDGEPAALERGEVIQRSTRVMEFVRAVDGDREITVDHRVSAPVAGPRRRPSLDAVYPRLGASELGLACGESLPQIAGELIHSPEARRP